MKEFYIDYYSNNCFSITNKCQRKKTVIFFRQHCSVYGAWRVMDKRTRICHILHNLLFAIILTIYNYDQMMYNAVIALIRENPNSQLVKSTYAFCLIKMNL